MDELAQVCERIASYNSRSRKVLLAADYLRALSDDDLARAVRFLCCGPVHSAAAGKFSIGGATLRNAALAATGLDSYVYGICYRDVGDTGETIAHLLHGRTENCNLSLAEADVLYARLFKMRRTADRVELLRHTLLRHRPQTLKLFIKVITGNLRIGFLSRQVEEAVAAATGVDHAEIRAAKNRLGDLAHVALSARHGRLHTIEARLFHPMDFMLAKPLDEVHDLPDPANWLVEDKYDGFRSQVHLQNGRVVIFTRGMKDVTLAFPELVTAFRNVAGPAVFDGEIVAWRGDRALSFNVLQQRIARKKLTQQLMEDVPVAFIAYDLLFGGGLLLDTPLEERRTALEQLLSAVGPPLHIAPQWSTVTTAEVETSFRRARERGNEGLILKRRASLYEPGRRSGTWLKVKRPYATLDVVVTAAEQGHGRRAIYFSDYTFGVRDGERFVNVGKAYSGLTDPEVRQLTRVFRAITAERFGRVALVRPEIVLEVAFDGIQKSARHKGGYALRFPRILRWRQDKRPEDADTLERVRELYEASIQP
jgi:DNA ligase-1